ncbi:MAG: hypothetical protein ACTSRZ_06945 [Promethearchaeota archaeon]
MIYQAELFGLNIGVLIGVLLLELVLAAVFLLLGLKVVDAENREFGTVIVTAIIMWLVGLIPIVGCIIQWFIIKSRHNTTLGKAIVAWLLAGLIPMAIMFGIMFALGFSLFSLMPTGTFPSTWY